MTFYWKGDKAEYTGESEIIAGETMYAAVLLEGHRKGETIWTIRSPESRVTA